MHDTEKEIKPRKQTKSIILRFIFSRFFLIAFVVLAEVFFMLYWFSHISSNWSIGSIILYDLLAIIILLNTNWQKNEYKVLWITILILLPGAGAILYFTYRLITKFGFASRKVDVIKDKIDSYNIDNEKIFIENLSEEENKSFFNYLYNRQKFLPMLNNEVKYFDDGKPFFDSLINDLNNATKSIYMEYFIISDGILWEEMAEILKKKADMGLDVKLMYDGLNITNDFSIKEVFSLRKHGVEIKMFGPIIPLMSSKQNNRDHRKITVIDNKIAYTGGMNLADEYANYYHKHGIWKDAGVRVEGDCAKSFTLLYFQVWMMTIKEKKQEFHDFLPYHILNDKKTNQISKEDFSYICAYTDFPNDRDNVSEDLFMMMIDYSYKYLYIMTPYLILNEGILDALIRAKNRGVDVRLVIPHIPDKPFVFYVSRSYYKILLANGIRCYEYRDGFVHSKVFLHDDKRAIVGTANFDYRSMYLHYEDGLYLYNDKSIEDIKRDFDKTFEDCIEYKSHKEIPFYQRLLGSILKVFAPQM